MSRWCSGQIIENAEEVFRVLEAVSAQSWFDTHDCMLQLARLDNIAAREGPVVPEAENRNAALIGVRDATTDQLKSK